MKLHCTWLTVLMGLAAATASAMTITSAPQPPTQDLLLASTAAGDLSGYLCERGLGAEVEIGQTFRLTSPATLDRLTLRVRPVTDVAGVLMILFFGTFSDGSDTTMNQLLTAEIRALPADLAIGQSTYLTFDIADQQLLAQQQYGFVVGFSGGDHPGPVELEILHTGANTYTSGQAIEWSGLSESALSNDLVFYLQGPRAGEPETLTLLNGRFAIQAAWRTATASGVGHPTRLTDETGTFWFFEQENVEIIIKVHDACVEPYQRYWVFMAGLTNVEVDLTVRDLESNFEHVYHSDRGEVFATVLDTNTFATCP